MAKIAVELKKALARRDLDGASGHPAMNVLAEGAGWTVADLVCTSGPQDRPFEERHSQVCIALVAAGSFQYRSAAGRELMTPGSLLLGNAGQSFECGHEHEAGDRCVAFLYRPDYFERLAAEAGARGSERNFRPLRLPPLRSLSPLVAQACAGLVGSGAVAWEELGIRLATQTVRLVSGLPSDSGELSAGAMARVTRIVRAIERRPDAELALDRLAREAGLSRYHFLRVFERLTGVTPHQYVLRSRLREAAMRLTAEPAKVLEIALDCGFGDVSNFNRAFRAEFGVSPRVYRRQFEIQTAKDAKDGRFRVFKR